MKPVIYFIFVLVSACGHTQFVSDTDTFDDGSNPNGSSDVSQQNSPQPDVAEPDDSYFEAELNRRRQALARRTSSCSSRTTGSSPTNCQGFATTVVSFEPGRGAGFGQSNFPDVVLGPPRGGGAAMNGFHVLSLGAGGRITLDTFPCAVVDGEGVDFLVFENPFWIGGDPENPLAELGEVSVSEDGETFYTFPCASEAYPYTGCAGWHPVFAHPDNTVNPFDPETAGGDPFDLADVGLEQACFIRIESISEGGPPPFTGFDLDAVAVVNGRRLEQPF